MVAQLLGVVVVVDADHQPEVSGPACLDPGEGVFDDHRAGRVDAERFPSAINSWTMASASGCRPSPNRAFICASDTPLPSATLAKPSRPAPIQ